MYFKGFGSIYYDFNIKGENQLKVVRDITTNVRVRKQVLSKMTIFDFYDMREGETPEIVAKKIYGNAELHWIIMLANDRYDYINDFPMGAHQLERYIDRTYGNNRNGVHHYELDGIIVDNTVYPSALPISNADYEYKLNDSKRRIKLVRREVVAKIIYEFDNLILGNSV
jgi:hypothetical protein